MCQKEGNFPSHFEGTEEERMIAGKLDADFRDYIKDMRFF